MTGNDTFRIYGQRIPARFGVSTLTKCLCTTKWDVDHLIADWLRRRWLRRIRAGHFVKTRKFGQNDMAHLQPEIFPRGRWTRRDILNSRLDELIVQHSLRRNKDRRPFCADQIEQLIADAVVCRIVNLNDFLREGVLARSCGQIV